MFDKLLQVLLNLLTNALRYGQGQPVSVVLRENGDEAVLCVRDQGPGVAPADHELGLGQSLAKLAAYVEG